MSYRLAVDIGGTFTDFALVDESSGRIAIFKQLTSQADPSKSVFEGAKRLLADEGVAYKQLSTITHGTTQ